MTFYEKSFSFFYFIIIVTIFLNACYVYEWHTHCESSYLFPEHASKFGYNFYKYGALTRLYEGSTYKYHGVVGTGQALDKVPNIKDTIGYGFLLGLLWKLTRSTSFYWVILLQVLLFTLSMCLLFQALMWFYQDQQKAIFGIAGVLSFLPAIYLNVQPVKDMWSFYGTAVLLWVFIGLIHHKINKKILCGSGMFFALCQWMRPTLFGVFMVLFIVGLPLFYYYFKSHVGTLKKMLRYFFLANICLFWIPWITYNKITYNRFFVGPTGLALLVSLSEHPNTWGLEPTESSIGSHVLKKYPTISYENETQEFDDVVKSIFIEYCKEEPLLYFKNLAKRILKLFVINLPWTAQFEEFWEYNIYSSKIEAFTHALQAGFFETIRCIVFFFYVRIFLLICYAGFFLMIRRSDRLLAILIVLCVVGNSGEILSHIEGKYFMQSFGFLGIFAGFFVLAVKNFFYADRLKRKKAIAV